MKLLFDQNLSRRLIGHLRDEFPDSAHVTALGLATVTDREIWEYAGEHNYVIVSKDSDFRQLAFLLGPPPKAIWLAVGNVSTTEVRAMLTFYSETIEAFSESDEEALLVLPGRGNDLTS